MDETIHELWQRFLATVDQLSPDQTALLYEIFIRSKHLFDDQEQYIRYLDERLAPFEEREARKRQRNERIMQGVGDFLTAMQPVMEQLHRQAMEQAAKRQQEEQNG